MNAVDHPDNQRELLRALAWIQARRRTSHADTRATIEKYARADNAPRLLVIGPARPPRFFTAPLLPAQPKAPGA